MTLWFNVSRGLISLAHQTFDCTRFECLAHRLGFDDMVEPVFECSSVSIVADPMCFCVIDSFITGHLGAEP